ncbi:hypothetical protein LRP67_06705 [Nocardioides sp. cx-169]|uniref:hypothetical protein n=1 Tax=Nocardioides sp. cx-169 TaxID=2899080 RepID=UPI001E4FB99F|nr:hypothetical protein [Nocardioides sp. cx-169]MCD4533768.1 hypothetical protein [Nocardioides sp. cx-169]
MTVVLWVLVGLVVWTLISLPLAVVVGRSIGRRRESEGELSSEPGGARPVFFLAA